MRMYRIQGLTMGRGGGVGDASNHFSKPETLLPPQKLYSLYLLKTVLLSVMHLVKDHQYL